MAKSDKKQKKAAPAIAVTPAFLRPEDLKKAALLGIVDRIHRIFFWDGDLEPPGWNRDKEVNGGDLVDEIVQIFETHRLLPPDNPAAPEYPIPYATLKATSPAEAEAIADVVERILNSAEGRKAVEAAVVRLSDNG